nr:hypothetical protein [Akkermansiaceae bacterium]
MKINALFPVIAAALLAGGGKSTAITTTVTTSGDDAANSGTKIPVTRFGKLPSGGDAKLFTL